MVLSPYFVAPENVDEPAQILIGLTSIGPASAQLQADWPDGTLAQFALAPASTVAPVEGLERLGAAQLAVLNRAIVPFGGLLRGRLAAGETLVVNGATGASAGIGLETARRARAEGASIILTGRNRERLEQAAREVGAERTAAFDANDPASLQSFFQDLPSPIDHVMVTAGAPHYRPPLEMSPEEARQGLTEHLLLALNVARSAARQVRPVGSLIFVGGTGARRPRLGLAIVSTATVAFPALVANLALELAPIRVNLIATGFVDTPLSASLLGDELEKRRDELRATLPIGRVVGPADVAALAVHIMSNTALTGATYDIDGGQQLVS